MNIYVGNLAAETAEPQLRETFEKFGEVTKVSIVLDKVDQTPRGFAFVEMTSDEHGQAAITGLNGTELGGKTLKVNVSTPKVNRP